MSIIVFVMHSIVISYIKMITMIIIIIIIVDSCIALTSVTSDFTLLVPLNLVMWNVEFNKSEIMKLHCIFKKNLQKKMK